MNRLQDGLSCCDVLIAGAGLAGSALAARLAQSGRSVVLVDPRPLGRSTYMDHGRLHQFVPSSARSNDVQWLPRSCVARLQRLGLDRWREQTQAEPLNDVFGLWGEPGGRDLFRAHPANGGWRVARPPLRAAALQNPLPVGAPVLGG